MDKRKLLTGLILFLIMTNIATILTVVLHINNPHQNTNKQKTNTVYPDTTVMQETQQVRYLSKKLGLTREQHNLFREMSWKYGRQARAISWEMSRLREDLLEEMDSETPDTPIMNSLSEQIGTKHVILKKLTVDHYLNLKSLCNEDQKRALYEEFRKIISPDGEVMPPGRGRPAGAGPPKNRGPWWQESRDTTFNK